MNLSDEGILPRTTVEQRIVHSYTSEITDVVKEVEPETVIVRSSERQGTGFIYGSAEDTVYVVGQLSVAENSAQVVFRNGVQSEAEVIGTDNLLGIAVFAVHPGFRADAVKFGDSDLVKAGEYVVALSARNPLTGRGGVSFGVVSNAGYEYSASGIYETLDTDVRLRSPDGAVLLNLDGELIGMISMMEGRALAVNDLKASVDEIIGEGTVTRQYLGISGQNIADMTLYERSAWDLPLDLTEGVHILRIANDSPAAGILETGDVIISADDTEIRDRGDLRDFLYACDNEEPVQITCIRDGERYSAEIVFP